MNPDDILETISDWIFNEAIEEYEAPEDNFYVETYEHAAIIRWGSKQGTFPIIGTNSILDETQIIISGEVQDTTIIADTNAKTTINVEQIAYKHFLETLMKNCNKGYEIITKPRQDGTFKITVEKIPTEK